MARIARLPEQNFIAKIEFLENGCWQWMGYLGKDGYSRFGLRIEGKAHNYCAHRWLYERINGPLEENMTLDHLCRNRGCVNPIHLEPVTIQENLMRGKTLARSNSEKTHCAHGHRFDEKNTYIRPNGSRRCRACNNRLEKMRRELHG